MKTVKFLRQIPLSVDVGGKVYGVKRFPVSRGPDRPPGFVLAAGVQGAPALERDPATAPAFNREIDLSAVYRTAPEFEAAVRDGFEISGPQLDVADVKRVIVALEKAKLVTVE